MECPFHGNCVIIIMSSTDSFLIIVLRSLYVHSTLEKDYKEDLVSELIKDVSINKLIYFIGTTYELREVTAAGQTSRLFFTSPTSNSMTRNITYPSVGTTVCSNITVYVQVRYTNCRILTHYTQILSIIIQNTTDISDFKLRADVNGVIRDNTPVSTNTFPIDLSGTPDISTVPGNIALRVATECGDDKICDSDLNLVVSKVTYRCVHVLCS